jgi:hypothetical protein
MLIAERLHCESANACGPHFLYRFDWPGSWEILPLTASGRASPGARKAGRRCGNGVMVGSDVMNSIKFDNRHLISMLHYLLKSGVCLYPSLHTDPHVFLPFAGHEHCVVPFAKGDLNTHDSPK